MIGYEPSSGFGLGRGPLNIVRGGRLSLAVIFLAVTATAATIPDNDRGIQLLGCLADARDACRGGIDVRRAGRRETGR